MDRDGGVEARGQLWFTTAPKSLALVLTQDRSGDAGYYMRRNRRVYIIRAVSRPDIRLL
jgi:hypothetical protein